MSIKIGTTIRAYRLQKGLSQGDIEKKTGLLRCYLSRVENGHTVPSLDTLAKIAHALDLPIAQFFASDTLARQINAQNLSDDELRFLTQLRRYSSNLNESDRKLLIAMVKKFAATAGALVPEVPTSLSFLSSAAAVCGPRRTQTIPAAAPPAPQPGAV